MIYFLVHQKVHRKHRLHFLWKFTNFDEGESVQVEWKRGERKREKSGDEPLSRTEIAPSVECEATEGCNTEDGHEGKIKAEEPRRVVDIQEADGR